MIDCRFSDNAVDGQRDWLKRSEQFRTSTGRSDDQSGEGTSSEIGRKVSG